MAHSPSSWRTPPSSLVFACGDQTPQTDPALLALLRGDAKSYAWSMVAASRPRSFDELWEALLDVPEGTSGEIVNGEIRTHPRPGAPHLQAASRLGFLLGPPFDFGSGGGPGGWVILAEPRIRFGEECRIPDLAAWRIERYGLPNAGRPYEVVPDWVCEVQSKSTAREDRTEKLPLYARHGVRHAWMIDAIGQTLEVFRLEGERWVLAQTVGGDTKVRAEPFDAVEIDLALLWARRTSPEE